MSRDAREAAAPTRSRRTARPAHGPIEAMCGLSARRGRMARTREARGLPAVATPPRNRLFPSAEGARGPPAGAGRDSAGSGPPGEDGRARVQPRARRSTGPRPGPAGPGSGALEGRVRPDRGPLRKGRVSVLRGVLGGGRHCWVAAGLFLRGLPGPERRHLGHLTERVLDLLEAP